MRTFPEHLKSEWDGRDQADAGEDNARGFALLVAETLGNEESDSGAEHRPRADEKD
jgi:hypothetical protein